MRHLSGERLFNELHRLHPTGWSSWECLNADEQREVAQALSVVMAEAVRTGPHPRDDIREARVRANMSVRDMAEFLGVSPVAYADYERGVADFTDEGDAKVRARLAAWMPENVERLRGDLRTLGESAVIRERYETTRILDAGNGERIVDAARRVVAERDRMREGWAAANEGVNERLDQAFLDGYGAAYIKARPDRFVAMAEYAEEAANALAEWHRADAPSEDTDGNACSGCGADIYADRTNCGALECGGGSLPDIGGSP